jgi:hypothetical protein
MKQKEKVFHNILVVTAIAAIIGVIALILNNVFGGPTIAFDLIAFITGVAALIMTTLQSISISRQLHITERSNDKLNETINTIEKLVMVDRKIAREVEEDSEFDHEIVMALTDGSIDDQTRQEIADTIRQAVKRYKK